MLTCPSCGVDNQLGRVFCSGCGAKLDLANMTSDAIQQSQQKSWIARFWWIIPVVILVIAAGLTALAFWPKSASLGEAGSRVDGRNVDRVLVSMSRLRKGTGGGKDLSAKEINAYFKYFTPMKETASIAVTPGAFKVRLVKRLAKVDLKFIQWTPKVSYDITCVPVGASIAVKGASMGHLPASGPLKKAAINGIKKEMARTKYWKSLSNITEIKIENDKIFVKYDKK